MIQSPFRVAQFESHNAAAILSRRFETAAVLSPRTMIVGIPINVENWPGNRSYLSIMRIGKPGSEQSPILQLSHFTEVKVIEVTDRHKIPLALGWKKPGELKGINIPSWYKVLSDKDSIADAIDDLCITYSHHSPDAENFYFLRSEAALSAQDRESVKLHPANLHALGHAAEAKLMNSRAMFTDADRPEWLGISADDWDDEIAYNPRFGVLRNHRGSPLVLFDFESERFGAPRNLRIWDGSAFTTETDLAQLLCKESTLKRKNFEIVSSRLVAKIWPKALKKSLS